ncbi:fatty acyl-CoA hydrolase precursor, medium chain-like [Gouania willdenowi]|uniref:fatty acyl-CoA hydrolase precursor, medium chain-like n=1 Tax=Gouania willdenowi TaxID=441366 RepID=UPI00105669E5|nr:fatty acyl-CoA hydrolase precursor, medium chain-like [Gouania willdenowi]
MEDRVTTIFCFLMPLLCLMVAADQYAPEVHTTLGALRGLTLTVKGIKSGVHAYLGVPFAKPPVGPSLRLRAPQPVEGWTGVRDATKQPLMCIQGESVVSDYIVKINRIVADLPEISEDCLYLNIFTPANRAQDAKLPVMVWIYGGGLTTGSASLYDGSALAAYEDVVVVLIQFRVGLLGFLSTGDENMSGNFGMLDQIQALKWIKEHIHNFGGNPDVVTVIGQSAGAVCVSLLLHSPLSHGLFHRAIAESGTAAMDLLLTRNPLPLTRIVANASGCNMESTEKIADCMRNLDLESIIPFAKDEIRFLINVDGHVLTKPVMESFKNNEFLTIPYMTGVNNHEGGWIIIDFFAPKNWTQGIDQEKAFNLLSIFFPNPKDASKLKVLFEEYLGTAVDPVKNRDGLTQLFGDMLFYAPAITDANAHRDAGAEVFLYEYNHAPKVWKENRPDYVKCDHGDEVLTVLGYCFATYNVKISGGCSQEEEDLSKIMMSYWANFARTGSPNGAGLAHWPKYGADGNYLKIDLKEQVAARDLKKDRFIYMTETLPETIKQHQLKFPHVDL